VKLNMVGWIKFAMLSATVCAVLVASRENASAARHPLPPVYAVSVPDGGATVMLLGLAVGALGIARRFLMR
jgi:hypothetical protein